MMSKKTISSILCSLMIFILIFGVVVSAFSDYDMSYVGSDGNVSCSAADIIEKYTSLSISNAEKEFLSYLSENDVLDTVEISYNEIINTDKVKIEYSGGALNLSAKEYEYMGVNGKNFKWVPVSASVGIKSVDLAYDDAKEFPYFANIVMQEPENMQEMTVKYKAEVKIEKNDINAIINLYRNTAELSHNSTEYSNYVIEKHIYDDASAMYEKYLNDLAEYRETKDAYDNYETVTLPKYDSDLKAYQDYLLELAEYDEKLLEYNKYLEKANLVKKQLDAVNLIDVKMTMDRTVYSAVMGGTVDSVLENEDAIVAAGAARDAVKAAGDSTELVRTLMKGFKACKTDEEKYAYYAANYDKFCEGFLTLTQTLDVLYRNKIVQAFIVKQGKNEKYIILVAQLALISNALIDGPLKDYNGNAAYNSKWTIYNKTIDQILENKTYFVDDDTARPITPPEKVEKPGEPNKVEKPTFPEKPAKPIEPDEVKNPGEAPTVVPNPFDNDIQPEALAVYNKLSANKKKEIAENFARGEVPSERNTAKDDITVVLQSEVVRKYNNRLVEITFDLGDGNTFVLNAESGSPVVCETDVPLRYTNSTGSYTFAGWELVNNARSSKENVSVDLSLGFDENVRLSPVYDLEPNYYNVTWNVNGETITQNVSAAIIPTCPLELKKDDSETSEKQDVYYEFAGFVDDSGIFVGKSIPTLERDTVYTAVFEEKFIVPISDSYGAKITYTDSGVFCDAKAFVGQSLYIDKLVERAAEKHSGITLSTHKITLKFTYTEVLTMKNNLAEKIELSYSGGSTSLMCSVNIVDFGGNIIDVNMLAEVFNSTSQNANMNLVSMRGDTKKDVKYSTNGGALIFDASSGFTYSLRGEYNVRVVNNALVDISVSKNVVTHREKVYYQIVPKDGVEILGVYIEDLNGNSIGLNNDGSFTVRDEHKGVNISVQARYKKYTITFKANGNVISEVKIEHGSEVKAPIAPVIGDDGVYSYEFAGWDKEISAATEDTVYSAVYEKTLIPVVEEPSGIKLSASVKKLFYLAVAAVLVFVVLIIVLVFVIVSKRKKKNKVSKSFDEGYDDYEDYEQ